MALVDNLIAFWELEEASGQRNDAHSTNHLTDNNTVAQGTGKVGNCADFEAANAESLFIADNVALSTGDIDFEICFWLHAETLTQTPILGKWQWAGSGENEYLFWFTSGGAPQFSVSSTGSNIATITWGANLSTATWYMINGWHDATNNQLGINVNAGTALTQAHAVGVRDGVRGFAIGASASAFYDGLIDQCGFWKRVLTGAERTELYNAGNGRAYSYINPGGAGRTTKNTRAFPLGVEVGMSWRV